VSGGLDERLAAAVTAVDAVLAHPALGGTDLRAVRGARSCLAHVRERVDGGEADTMPVHPKDHLMLSTPLGDRRW